MWSGHPTGMWESSRSPSPFCSMIVPNIGTSIVALRLTCARLHFHVSGAKRPLPANSSSDGNSGWSFVGNTSSLITNFSPCSWLGLFFLRVMRWLGCGILGCCVFKPGGAERLDTYGTCRASGFDAFSAQAMVDGRDHPCRHKNCDKLHIPNDLQILRLNFRCDTSYLTIDHSGV